MAPEVERFRKDNGDLRERLKQVPELEKKNTNLSKENSGLLEQVGNLSMELQDAKETNAKGKKELATSTVQVVKLQKECDAVKVENENLKANLVAESGRNAKLRSDNAQLEANQTVAAVGGNPMTSAEKAAYEQKIATLEEQKAKSQSALAQWQKLAKVRALSSTHLSLLSNSFMTGLLQRVQGDASALQRGRADPRRCAEERRRDRDPQNRVIQGEDIAVQRRWCWRCCWRVGLLEGQI